MSQNKSEKDSYQKENIILVKNISQHDKLKSS